MLVNNKFFAASWILFQPHVQVKIEIYLPCPRIGNPHILEIEHPANRWIFSIWNLRSELDEMLRDLYCKIQAALLC